MLSVVPEDQSKDAHGLRHPASSGQAFGSTRVAEYIATLLDPGEGIKGDLYLENTGRF